MLSEAEEDRKMNRTEVIVQLKEAYEGHATWYSEETYQYLLGYVLSNKRGICLAWADEDVIVTKEVVVAAYQEVNAAQLARPFLLFGTSKWYNDQACIFLQVRVEGDALLLPSRLWKGEPISSSSSLLQDAKDFGSS